jgi:hypothetical protein
MKGPLHVIRRRRAERPANGVETAQAATEAPTQAHPNADLASAVPAAAGDQVVPPAAGVASGPPPAATVQEQPAAEVPAGQEPVPDRPSFRQRGRLRRRLRYLRRVRELGFRDLGGLVFDQHRFARPSEALVQTKVAALGQIDGEVRALEHALHDKRAVAELREAGIAACPRCGAIHGSESRYCPTCGLALSGPTELAAAPAGGPPPPTPVATPPASIPMPVPATPTPTPASAPAAPVTSTPPAATPPATTPPSVPAAPEPTPAPAPAADTPQPPSDHTIHLRPDADEQPTTVLRAADVGSAPVTGGDPLTGPQPAERPELTTGDPLAERDSGPPPA